MKQRKFIINNIAVILVIGFAAFASFALDYPHSPANYYDCSNCHDINSSNPYLVPEWTGDYVMQDEDDVPLNHLCRSCHYDGGPTPAHGTHSYLTFGYTSETSPYGHWQVRCTTCHDPHYQQQFSKYRTTGDQYWLVKLVVDTVTISGTSSTLKAQSSPNWEEDVYKDMKVVPNINAKYPVAYKVTGNNSDTLTIKGQVTGVVSGNTAAVIYGKLVRAEIRIDDILNPMSSTVKTGIKKVKFFRATGPNSCVDGDTIYDGVCEVCHTNTDYHRNNASGVHNHNMGVHCSQCHDHGFGFSHGGGGASSNCVECHGHDPGYGGYTGGKGTYASHSTHTENDSDDIRGPNAGCGACHDTGAMPDFKSGTDSNGDGRYSLSETDVCDSCHSSGGTYNGVTDGVLGAKNNWSAVGSSESLIYAADGSLKSGKEKWCASCHDESPSQIQSINAPNVVGDEDGSFTYGTGWGFYKTGHGLSSGSTYPASGGVTAGAGKGCLDCHLSTVAHTDGNARTFDCGNGCDSTEYRQSYRLKQIGGQEPMFIPWAQNNSNDAIRYRLCSQAGCHDSAKFTDSGNMNTNFVTDSTNRHVSHLVMNSLQFSADYNYGSSNNSRITCAACHNVHGSTRLAMVRDGKLIDREPGLRIWYRNDDLVDWDSNSPNSPNPQNLPLAASTGMLVSYNSSTNLCSHCHGANNLTGESRSPYQNVEQTPTLDWAGQPGYESDGVNPDSGAGGSSFTFKVKYTDTNNDSPTVYQVWIDEDDSGGYGLDEKFDMAAANPGDVNLTDGKIYKYSKALLKNGDNNINYCFTFSDGGTATGAPACGNNQQVLIINNAPTLAWTEETNYASDGVYPDSGGSGTSFAFRIKYTDKDNEAPSSIQLWVDKNNNAAYEDNADPDIDEKVDMTIAAGGDGNYINGELYEKAVILSTAGNLKYRYYASDSFNTATGTPTEDSAGTVQVTSGANGPALSWTGETGYTNDGVDPDSGPQGGHFIFRIKYTDTDNNPPSQIKVWVDAADANMTEVDSNDDDYSDGKLYYADIIISSTGDHSYTFTAKDSNNTDATGDPTSNNTVTATNAVSVDCASGSIQTAINNASDGDTILVADGVCSENINYGSKNITIKSLNGAVFTTLQGTGANSPVVTFSGGQTSSALLDGFTIDNQNSGGTNGRGISISNNSSPTIKNSIVAGNSINSGYDGAGIYIVTGGGATIQNTKIGISGNANTARYGSGLYASTTGTISISDSTISYNTGLFGAGIYLTNVAAATTFTGTSIDNNSSSQSAGGIYAYNSAISLTNCTLNNNSVGDIGSYDGGGIYLNGASAGAVISGTIINGNSGRNGGGIYILGSTLATPLSITNSLISGNSGRYGAGIYITGAANASAITDSTITGNTTDQGYAGIYSDSPLTVAGSHIDDNTVTGESFDTAGLMLNGASANGSITNTTFNSNTARSGSGFAVRNGASLILTGGIISGNTAYSGGTGAIWVDAGSTLNMSKSIVRSNQAGTYGGGIYTAGNTVIENCIITGNIADAQAYSDGGGIYNTGTLTVTNSSIAGNYARRNGGGLNGGGAVKNSIIWGNTCDAVGPQIYGSPTVTYSDIEAGYGGGTNIIDSAPSFADFIQAGIGVPTAEGDFHIASNSTAKNTANNPDAPADDIDGNTRPLTGGDPADMGADEYTSAESESPVVTAFTASLSTRLHIPITSLTATDNVGVTGYMITTSATPPSAIGEVWLSSAPATYIAAAEGTYTLYPWVKDAAGNVSALFDSPRTVVVDTAEPSIDTTSPANGATDVALNSTVTINWNENVDCTTVTTSTVTISPSGGWTRSSCSGSQAVFTPSGQSGSTVYTITVSTSVKDVNGNAMASGYQFSYTTVPPTVAAPTIGTPAALSTTSIRWNFTDNSGNEEGFKVHDSSNTVKASSATPNLSYLDETGLTANTQYTRHVHAYKTGEDSLGSGNASTYTLPATPNVTADKTVSIWYSTTDVVFTNAAGFGAGGVQYYRYVWDNNTTCSFNDTETQWTTGTLTKTSTSTGSWYLHVKSYNAGNIANGTRD
ncbi:MAG: Ig-like domain-containing protein [Nitrospirae bacterium]|nr:Ig-like domain-containing protein [Nitrospirota bacterium]